MSDDMENVSAMFARILDDEIIDEVVEDSMALLQLLGCDHEHHSGDASIGVAHNGYESPSPHLPDELLIQRGVRIVTDMLDRINSVST